MSAAALRSMAPAIALAALPVAGGVFFAEISLRDINDPGIVIARQS